MGMPLFEQPSFRAQADSVRQCAVAIREQIRATALLIDAGKNTFTASLETKIRASKLYEEASRTLMNLGGKEAFYCGSPIETNFRDSIASTLYSGPNDVLQGLLDQLS